MTKDDVGTRDQILRLIVEQGPITAADLAKVLVLTPAAVRRHITTLEDEGLIASYDGKVRRPARRGRPSRYYVVTPEGQSQLSNAYSDLATNALLFLKEQVGQAGVAEFVERRMDDIAERYLDEIDAAGSDPSARAEALAAALTRDGFAATIRTLNHGRALQLCQGHCPVLDVASEFPEMCEVETEAFSRLLGVHVQRLATLAGGEHVCTTHVPTAILLSATARRRASQAGDTEGNR